MDDKTILDAVRRLGDEGYRPATFDMISDKLRWTDPSSSLEGHLDQFAAAGELLRVKRPDCDPEYATRLEAVV